MYGHRRCEAFDVSCAKTGSIQLLPGKMGLIAAVAWLKFDPEAVEQAVFDVEICELIVAA